MRVTGKVKWFNARKNLGFITRDDDGTDVFVHRNHITPDPAGARVLTLGDRVEFDVVPRGQGPTAENVVKLQEAARGA